MKNRYFTCTLILLVLLTCGILIKADSQIPQAWPKLKVGVHVQCSNNQNVQSLIESHIKSELRSLGDVEIVGNNRKNPLWKFLIDIHAIEREYKSGEGIGFIFACTKFFEKVSILEFKEHWQPRRREFPGVFFPSGSIAYHPIDDLVSYCKATVADFEKDSLQPFRDRRHRSSR